MKKHIFLSYGHDEYQPFVELLYNRLNSDGYDVFFDKDKIKAAHPWDSYIEEGLDKLRENPADSTLLLIMTNYSVRRPDGFCLNELTRAIDLGIDIFPVKLEEVVQPLGIYRIQYLDLSQKSISSDKKLTENVYKSIKSILDNFDKLDKEGSSISLKHDLDPVDLGVKDFFDSTSFVGREKYIASVKDWLNSDVSSSTFCLWGSAGVGKSTLASYLYNQIPNVIAFYWFKRGRGQKQLTKAITSIAYEISNEFEEYRNMLLCKNIPKLIKDCDAVTLFTELVALPLKRMKPCSVNKLIIIDGVDEMEWVDNTNPAAVLLARFGRSLPKWVKLLITSRPENNVKKYFKNGIEIQSGLSYNEEDLSLYVDLKLADYRNTEGYESYKSAILAKSQGVFLFVSYLCDEIIHGERELSTIDQLPYNLDIYYSDYFRDRFRDKALFDQNAVPLLSLILASTHPIKVELLKRLCCLDEVAFYRILNSLSGLFYQNADKCIVPAHSSVIEWLQDETLNLDYLVSSSLGLKNIHCFYKSKLDDILKQDISTVESYYEFKKDLKENCDMTPIEFFSGLFELDYTKNFSLQRRVFDWICDALLIVENEYEFSCKTLQFFYSVSQDILELFGLVLRKLGAFGEAFTIKKGIKEKLLKIIGEKYPKLCYDLSQYYCHGNEDYHYVMGKHVSNTPYALMALLNSNLSTSELNENIHDVMKLLSENQIKLFYSSAVDRHCKTVADKMFHYLNTLFNKRMNDFDEISNGYLSCILQDYKSQFGYL